MITFTSDYSLAAYAKDVFSINFEYKDWQIACDNTRTCRAAGYSPEDATNRVTVLLTRKAGIGQDIVGRVRFADIQDNDKIVDLPDKIILTINGKSYGEIIRNTSPNASMKEINVDDGSILLTFQQTQALLQALKGTAKIVFVGGDKQWVLPDDGAAAVLLKMDDAQGRVGTDTALIKKGSNSEKSVLPALPVPVVYQQPLPKDNLNIWQSKVNWNNLKRELLKTDLDGNTNYCSVLTDKGNNDYQKFEPKVEAVLTDNRLLVSGLCWRGAYNEGYGFWMINQKQPYHPKLITTMADSLSNNEILSSAKGRGLGDCWSRQSWIWNGDNFVQTYKGDSGMCRMIAAGGAWELPTYVTTVK